jgi:hypothetical protein
MGSLIKPTEGNGIVTFHHNLWSNNGNRNPAIGNYSDDDSMRVDLRNNVLYNNRSPGYSSGESERIDLNYVGNYVIAGPDTSNSNRLVGFKPSAANNVHIFAAGNRLDGDLDGMLDGIVPFASFIDGPHTAESQPHDMAPVTTHPAAAAYELVRAQAGAFHWSRDEVDARLMAELAAQSGQIINSQEEVGGYPDLPSHARPGNWDTDGDGMPDLWERRFPELDPAQADNNGDLDGDGYTNLEEYLHFCATGHAVPEPSAGLLMGPLVLALAWHSIRRA